MSSKFQKVYESIVTPKDEILSEDKNIGKIKILSLSNGQKLYDFAKDAKFSKYLESENNEVVSKTACGRFRGAIRDDNIELYGINVSKTEKYLVAIDDSGNETMKRFYKFVDIKGKDVSPNNTLKKLDLDDQLFINKNG